VIILNFPFAKGVGFITFYWYVLEYIKFDIIVFYKMCVSYYKLILLQILQIGEHSVSIGVFILQKGLGLLRGFIIVSIYE
jgi:hypothetical protein